MWLLGGAYNAVPVPFSVDADIAQCTIPAQPVKWGMDVAWDSEDNVVRGTNYIGKDNLSVGRVSFQTTDLLDDDGNLSQAQQTALQTRLDHIALSGVKDIILNSDQDAYYTNSTYVNNYKNNTQNWYKLIKATVLYCRSKGFNVITVSPFNEPDYTAWNQGTQASFNAIAKLISEDSDLAGIRISAGNTLNCDQALSWYNAVKPYVTEGNTHQLAGSLDNYTKFWDTVTSDGNWATADELHNTMEAFIGIHHGVKTGVWWGWEGICRGEFCKASTSGKEIGYAENSSAWTGAAVYKRADGTTDAFLGSSERQATTSSFNLISTDRPVYFDSYGPVYSFSQEIPGGTAYQTGQTNAERRIQILSGEDVPVEQITKGVYVIMNCKNKRGIGYANAASDNGTLLAPTSFLIKPQTHMQWIAEPVDSRVGGDFGYFVFRSNRDTLQVMDLLNWSTSAGGRIIGYAGSIGNNEQWALEYAGDNYWYIRSRHSGLYIEMSDAATVSNSIIQQAVFTGSDNQKWRFMPAGPKMEVVAPAAPTQLSSFAQTGSIRLSWQASEDTDVAAYEVLRSREGSSDIDVIGRMIEGTEFVDNDVIPGVSYIYKVKAIDLARNRSLASETTTAQVPAEAKALIAHYSFEKSVNDTTENVNDALLYGIESYSSTNVKEGTTSLNFNGSSNYLMLPPSVGQLSTMTIAMWAYIGSTSSWSRLFDFGNGQTQYFFLTPNNGSQMRVVLKNGGDEQILSASKVTTG